MTDNNKRKTTQDKSNGLQYKAFVLTAILLASISIYGLQAAFAVTQVTLDPGIGCGNRNWGKKMFQNSQADPKYIFGFASDCVTKINPAIGGRNNYVQLTTTNTAKSTDDIAWQAALQGKDPWGCLDNQAETTTCGGAVFHNTSFDNLAANISTFALDGQYYWVSDAVSKPNAGAVNGQVNANLLANLWFADEVSAKTPAGNWKNVVVIDFAYHTLTNSNGAWVEGTTADQDTSSPGTQYYRAFYEQNPNDVNQRIYHYNIYLDTAARSANTWYAPGSVAISGYIADAFAHSYPDKNGNCTCQSPGSANIGNYKVVDQEIGAEIFAKGNAGLVNYGTIKAAYSTSNLTY